jgi:hypothetical protein
MSDKKPSNTNLYFSNQRICSHVSTNVGNIHFASYMEPAGSTPTTDRYANSQDDKVLTPLPHQEQAKGFFDYTCDDDSDLSGLSSTKTDKEKDIPESNAILQEKQTSEDSPSLKNHTKDPLQTHVSIVTPLTKTTLGHNNLLNTCTGTVVAFEKHNTTPTSNNKNLPMTNEKNKEKEAEPNPNLTTPKNTKTTKETFEHLTNSVPTTIYSSPLVADDFKPSAESLVLVPELESLKLLIMSQHEAFTQPIKDLGLINLDLSKILEKKKESLRLLQQEKKIPRSLRIKCELTTSPSYTNNPVFLKLKTNLQQKVSTFITEGARIMTEWTSMNVQLLTIDRCSNILTKALQILDGLTSFHIDVLGNPIWPSVEDNNIPLFLLKFYFYSKYFNTEELSVYLDTPPEDILLIGAKIWLNNQSEDNANKLLESFKLNDIDMENQKDYILTIEILRNFDQILKLTTIDIWQQHKKTAKQTAAAIKLQAKMKSMEVLNATTATAQAIAKATDSINYNQILNANANLRIANLEKSLHKQEQKSNTIINQLKSKNSQKNLTGSHFSESMASPEKSTLLKKHLKPNLKRNLVDLTTEDSEVQKSEEITSPPYTYRKKQKQHKQKNSRTPTRKTVQWKEGEVKDFHPNYPVAELFSNQAIQNPFMMNSHTQRPPLFPTPPPPPPSYQPNFHLQPNITSQFSAHHHFLNQPQPINPFNHTNYSQNKFAKSNLFTTSNYKNF